MNFLRKTILPVLLASFWISLSEFVRNQFLLNSIWEKHYRDMGLIFPSAPVNGLIWGLWSLFFAITIFIIGKKFNLLQTSLLAWFFGFVLMWITLGNLGVLPFGILAIAIPLSLLESFVAALILSWFQKIK